MYTLNFSMQQSYIKILKIKYCVVRLIAESVNFMSFHRLLTNIICCSILLLLTDSNIGVVIARRNDEAIFPASDPDIKIASSAEKAFSH